MGIQQLLRFATQWPVNLDQASRRNAMVASTALAQRRLEYLEVEEFLGLHQRRFEARRGAALQPLARRTG